MQAGLISDRFLSCSLNSPGVLPCVGFTQRNLVEFTQAAGRKLKNSTYSLKTLRKSRGITQGDVSKSTGISVSHISAAEKGKRRIADPAKQKAIAEFFSVNVDSIEEFDENYQGNSTLGEELTGYHTRGLPACRVETLEAMLDAARALRDWPAVEAIAYEIRKREKV
ncbi:XRE family transcriptional regulator [Verrucomicrobia bacterium S94]|nr:XRE family transcriptional regulator [Verrucomicrobia bacterium S94]